MKKLVATKSNDDNLYGKCLGYLLMMLEVKRGFDEDYYSQGDVLGKRGVHQILDAGRAWDVSETLRNGGSAIFPHTYLSSCGDQIAAVVHGCLDSGADQVLVLGVVHNRWNKKLRDVRLQEMRGEELTDETYWGVFPTFEGEYSLFHFKTLWEAEVKRRGIKAPKLIVRYPCLVNARPECLLGVEELERIAKDAVVVSTGDLVHNGVAYKTDPQLEIGSQSEGFTRDAIHEGFNLLKKGKYREYYHHSIKYRNDAKDTCTVIHHLLGPLKANILDLRLVDTGDLFIDNPSPSWVAASLVTLEPWV
ncbi:MAG: hypothetical protein KFB95_03705 [Simkaniaceae bacterium]|nr:MAG: hypothetical protein KFB95_03705 [Simkaniaceae bacterium]